MNISEAKITSFDDGYINIVLVGRVTKEKGYWRLAESLVAIEESVRKKIRIHAFGDSPPNNPNSLDCFNRYLIDLGISDLFILYGFTKTPADYMYQSDLVIVPSVMVDPFPTTILEAFSLGKAVITSDHGGASEIVKHGRNGLLYSNDSESGLSELLREVVSGKYDLLSIGEEGNQFYIDNLSISSFKKRIQKEFNLDSF
nr:glycosyltransferase [Salinivibrio sp. VYel1]